MSCFDITTCYNDQIFNRINCNFRISYLQHICNPTNTCQRIDGLYDCCASNIADCIIEQYRFLSLPTTAPTISPNIFSECEKTCNLAPSTNKCYWYESQIIENSCIDKDNNYCCSHSRSDCCQASISYMIIFGSLFFLLMTCVFYHVIVFKYIRVVPEANTSNLL